MRGAQKRKAIVAALASEITGAPGGERSREGRTLPCGTRQAALQGVLDSATNVDGVHVYQTDVRRQRRSRLTKIDLSEPQYLLDLCLWIMKIVGVPLARVIVRQMSGSYFGRLGGDRFVLASPTVEMEGAHTSIALISGSVSVNP
ncbi:hypothetical protein [Bradyrhizobium sp. NBAIM08]|uniref:hypothetical protein n=1 Tax=Bradyrhizobium sp. NBAIM08 TaxID=2793815 RepID=UPI001CD55801|nr:hypothetical protein [Bradyrhizobium sp. NBAIM08]MCA1479862.1 hypothetical protein [Bradyrhizobium sp. NBAIM08]